MTLKEVRVIPNSQQTYQYCLDAIQQMKDDNYDFKYSIKPVYGGKKEFKITVESSNVGLIMQITNLVSLAVGRTKISGSTYEDYIVNDDTIDDHKRSQSATKLLTDQVQESHNRLNETTLKADILDLQLNELTAEEIMALSFEQAHQYYTKISRQADIINQYLHLSNLDDTEENIIAVLARTDLPTGTKRTMVTPPG